MHTLLRPFAIKSSGDLARAGVILALAGLILFGALRYDNFLSPFNILSFLRYNSMFALIALGMAFVIITGASISRSAARRRWQAWSPLCSRPITGPPDFSVAWRPVSPSAR